VSAVVARRAWSVQAILDGPVLFDVASASEVLGCSAYAVREAVQAGSLGSVRQGRLVKITRVAILQYLRELPP
jgi:excisionase family DNA binding protein